MEKRVKNQITKISLTTILMIIGLIILKFIPMKIFGQDILFDASMHITITSLGLYITYFFIDQNKSWKIPYFIFCAIVLIIVAFQRIIANAHNDIGILLGLLLSIISIAIPRWKRLRRKIEF